MSAASPLTVSWIVPQIQHAASGAVSIEFTVTASGAGDGDLRLRVAPVHDPDAAHEKPLRVVGGSANTRVVVNTHLLPNGVAAFDAAVLDANGRRMWSDRISFPVHNAGPLSEAVRASVEQFGTPLLAGACDSSHYDYGDGSLRPWFERPDATETIHEMTAAGAITPAEADALRQFVEDGYLVVPERIEPSLLDLVDREIDDAVASQWQGYTYGSSQRLEHLHDSNPGIRRLWQHPLVYRYLDLLFGVPAKPCQTLVYVFGSEQSAHQDSIHLTSFPAAYMCGVWIALEDVQPESGELEIYPGSHRLPPVRMHTVNCPKIEGDWSQFGKTVVQSWRRSVAEHGLEKVTYRPKRGTILIWHENLLHAGSPRTDRTRTRRSVVLHAFAEGAIAYYDSTGMAGFTFERE